MRKVCYAIKGRFTKNFTIFQLELTVYDYENDEKLIYRSNSTGFSFKTKSGDDLEIELSETSSMNRIKSNGISQYFSDFGNSSDIQVYCGYKTYIQAYGLA